MNDNQERLLNERLRFMRDLNEQISIASRSELQSTITLSFDGRGSIELSASLMREGGNNEKFNLKDYE